MNSVPSAVDLRAKVTCPHCWQSFSPEEVLWVAAHADLMGDPMLPSEPLRFLPTRFTVSGLAIDVKGAVCEHLACPNCHLHLPRVFLEMSPLFVSIFGSPFCGKSNFLAAMTWQLKTTLRTSFHLDFANKNPLTNQFLGDNHTKLFNNPRQDELVVIDKTQQAGELYQPVLMKGQRILLPRPLVFSISPDKGHAAHDPLRPRNPLARVLCLYDNAGEQFLPGGESASQPCKHLAVSRVKLFLFDPTQHPRFRLAGKDRSKDPQFRQQKWLYSQDQVLAEAAMRIRSYSEPRLSQHEKIPGHLVVVVSKFDAIAALSPRKKLLETPVIRKMQDGPSVLHVDALQAVSSEIRGMLAEYAGEIVNEAESSFQDVIYIPASAFGRPPEQVGDQPNLFGIRPRDVHSQWTEVPMLYALHEAAPKLVPVKRHHLQVVDRSDFAPPRLKETG
jgi:hypothetical protein